MWRLLALRACRVEKILIRNIARSLTFRWTPRVNGTDVTEIEKIRQCKFAAARK